MKASATFLGSDMETNAKCPQKFASCVALNRVRVCLVEEPTVTEWNGSIPEEWVCFVPVFGRCKKVERVGSVPVFGLEEWNEKLNNRNSKIRQHFICIFKKNNITIYIDIELNFQQ